MSTVNFDSEALLTTARKLAALDDFGRHEFRPGLESILKTYDSNDLTEAGRRASYDRILKLLVARLRIEDGWKRYPEILDVEIKAPMILTGMPRTGTSALVNLLALDSNARPVKMWEGLNPCPLEGLPTEQNDPRYLEMKMYFDELKKDPEMLKIHEGSVDGPEECIHLTNHTFEDVQYGVEGFMEPYATYFRQVDRRPIYQYHHNLLRMLQWQRPGERFLLKAPYHLWSLDILLKEYPDSSILITHRNPVAVVGSYCSMMHTLMPDQENIDKADLGRRVFNYLADQVTMSIEARKIIGNDRILDIQYNDFVGDSLATIKRIYDRFELPMSDVTWQAMDKYMADHPKGRHGKHDYRLVDFGLTDREVLDRFSEYIDTYQVEV